MRAQITFHFSAFFLTLATSAVIFSFSPSVHAAEIMQDKTEVVEAIVISIDKVEKGEIEFAGLPETTQTITATVLSGSAKGKLITMENDYILLDVGQKFFANRITHSDDGNDTYTILEPNRLGSILFFAILFLIILLIFGGIQGIRGLASLIGSLGLIMYVLIPGILHGYSPILVSLGASSIIIIVGSFITHGFNKTTLSAVIGMIVTVTLTGILASIAVKTSFLSGYSDDATIYLNYNTEGIINMSGLLLGGILIGLLGVLYDSAIGQAVAIEELLRANPAMSKKTLYKRATRIGREHIGALVNTLAIAYVGVALPLLLLFSTGTPEPIHFTINREIFATEIVRTLVGSIGLILAVPITTFVTILILTRSKTIPQTDSGHSH
ncbi:MAG: YibE/F family protein [Patescibacteria group bacterium]